MIQLDTDRGARDSGSLLGLSVRPQACAGRDGQPAAFPRGTVGGLVAVDQTKAGLTLVCRDVETNPAAIGKLRVKAQTHQFANERVAFAFDQ